MDKAKALEWYGILLQDMKDCDLKEALQMGRDALAEKEEDTCEECMVHYQEDEG